jgi:hypothetical protein
MSTAAIRYIQFYPENFDSVDPIFQPEDWEMWVKIQQLFSVC